MSKNKHSKKPLIITLIVIIALLIGGYFGYNYVTNDINGSNDKNQIQYKLVIESDDYGYEIGQKLYHNKIVVSDVVWTNWMDKHYKDFVYINGEYNLNSSMSYEEIATKLQNPDVSHKSIKVCIPEGYNVFDISKALEDNGICSAKDFLTVCKSTDGFDYDWLKDFPKNDLIAYKLEGFLFPATYDLPQNSDPHHVADKMLDAFDSRITKDMTKYCEDNNTTLYELITLSSIVQKEALGNNSAGKIASVFVNRLNKGAKLQSDVTYFYAKDLRDEYGFSQKVYDAYYTYNCKGLSAGPVCCPGLEIINATVSHPKTDYLYFFSYNNGSNFYFTDSYDKFQSKWEKVKHTNTENQ